MSALICESKNKNERELSRVSSKYLRYLQVYVQPNIFQTTLEQIYVEGCTVCFKKFFPYVSFFSALLGVHRTQSLKGRSSSARAKKSSTEEETINGSRRRQRLSSITDTEKSSYQSYDMTKTPKRSPIVWMIPPNTTELCV